MLRYLALAATLAAAPAVVRAQDSTHRDTTHHDSSAAERKSKNAVDNAGEGVKQANDQVDNAAYKAGTGVKNLFRPKKKPTPKPDSTAKHAKADTAAKRDSTAH